MGHGDAMHLTQFDPASASLQVWACHENRKDGSSFRDAKTGKVLLQYPDKTDVGRCMAAEIDPTSPGVEMWSLASGGIRNIKGEVVAEKVPGLSYNMAVWWDGDLLRELLDKGKVSKYDWKTNVAIPSLHLKDVHLTMARNPTPHFRATLSVTGEKRCWFVPRTTSLSACT